MEDKKMKGHKDVIVIGGGVNGLVTAAYLAKAGRKTLLFEKKEMVGGIAVSESFFPGYTFSSLVDGAGHLSPAVVTDLKLNQHGLETVSVDPVVYSLQPNGENLLISQDVKATAIEIANFSEADADAYPNFIELLNKIAAVIEALLHITPPDAPEVGWGDLKSLFPMLKPLRKIGRKDFAQVLRLMPMPVADLLMNGLNQMR